jgi:DNA-binding CsgD family transcriptional regulator
MTPNNSRLNILPSPPRPHFAAQQLDQFQSDLVSRALKRAVDDVGAAMAHQLSEPLTALLLYLNEIKQAGESCDGTETILASVRDMVDMALRETERVCDIMERVGQTVEVPIDTETALARGREAIDAWTRNSDARGGYASLTAPYAGQHRLTPREHEVLALITGGASNKEGGHRLGISKRTFEAHRAHLMGKLGAKNAADLVRITLSQTQ